jgi:hypothetical protein
MNKRRVTILTWVLLAVLLILSSINIYLLVAYRESLDLRLQSDAATRDSIMGKIEDLEQKSLQESKVRDIIESYPIKEPTDGVDGLDGRDGKDGVDGNNGIDGYTPQKDLDYFDGATPFLRCNQSENRWEIRYSKADIWEILNNEIVKCVGI